MEDKINSENVNKLSDINYALMTQLSYLHWNNLEDKKYFLTM